MIGTHDSIKQIKNIEMSVYTKAYSLYSLRFANLLSSEISKELRHWHLPSSLPPSPSTALRQHIEEYARERRAEEEEVDIQEQGHIRIAAALLEAYHRLCTTMPSTNALGLIETGDTHRHALTHSRWPLISLPLSLSPLPLFLVTRSVSSVWSFVGLPAGSCAAADNEDRAS